MSGPSSFRRYRFSFGAAAAISLLAGAALAQGGPPGEGGGGSLPLRADPRPFTQVYGAELAGRVFSDRLAAVRRSGIAASLARVPGLACPERPGVVLAAVFPWRGMGNRRAWIERFEIACRPAAVRNFLIFEEGEGLRRVELAPGRSNADPLLQRDLLPGLVAATVRTRPEGCSAAPVVTDVAIARRSTAPAPGARAGR